MGQLSLELRQYPRPIAWTISEVDRAVGDRDRRDMLFAAFEEIIRYLVLVELARYTEYHLNDRGDETVEQSLVDLRRPSFGHHLKALTALDQYLVEASDPCAMRITEKRDLPRIKKFIHETGSSKPKDASIALLFSRVIELRNRDKGHGYTGQRDARIANGLLQPALIEVLEKTPLLLDRPLVWVDSIEYLGPGELTITFLELMGTQRARRLTRQVHDPGTLKKGFICMWDGESAPLQMTPFLHLEEADQDELVFVLAGISRDPVYQARGSSSGRRPDQLMSQLEERVPFLLKNPPSITVPRAPDAAKIYRQVVELALADGDVTAPEAERLERMRSYLGLGREEGARIHRELGWDESTARTESSEPDAWPEIGRWLAAAARDAALKDAAVEPSVFLLDEDLDIRMGKLWLQLGRTQGVALSYPSKRGEHVWLALGFYSQNAVRDKRYRDARNKLDTGELPERPKGWLEFSHDSKLDGMLALESRKRFAISELRSPDVVTEVGAFIVTLFNAAQRMLSQDPEAHAQPAPVEDNKAPVSAPVPETFALEPLKGSPRLQGSVWVARILWALEYARRSNAGPCSAADIARSLQQNEVDVPSTNTARAFRTPRDDPRMSGLCEEPLSQKYVISNKGRRVLFEWMRSTNSATIESLEQ